jgi:L-ascorbate metabolism protein UlaG (beta-lactamase superfamily)
MLISKFGHACLLVESGKARILIDPGAFSQGFEKLTDLDAIFITHQHPDHLVPEHIQALLSKSPRAQVFADEDSSKILSEKGIDARMVHEGDSFEVAGVPVQIYGKSHAVIHLTIPGISNVGYYVDSKFFYPGDSFTNPDQSIEVLAIPASAPWLKVSEAIDYLLEVKPKVAIPVHDGVLSDAGRKLHFGVLQSFGEESGIEVRVVETGKSIKV